MIKRILSVTMMLWISRYALASGFNDDPLLYKVMIDKLEARSADGNNPAVWAADAWLGKDLNKIWLKTEGERVNGNIESAEVQLLYSRAIAPFWDFQAGWRHDLKPKPTRDWLAIGFKGLSPYMFEVDTSLFLGKSGQIGARLAANYDYLLTQKLILTPDVEMNLYSKDDEKVGVGSGLSDIALSLRLRYEIRREFAPYVGVNWGAKFGKTADYTKNAGGKASELQWVAGIRVWF